MKTIEGNLKSHVTILITVFFLLMNMGACQVDIGEINAKQENSGQQDTTAPANQDTVLSASSTVQGGSLVAISPAGSDNTVWLAPAGTISFAQGSDMTSASGTETAIAAPSVDGVYYLYVVDSAGNVSQASSNSITVNNTPPLPTPAAPGGVTLVTPASSPGSNPAPVIEISGVGAGDSVALFTDSTCTAQVASGTAAGGVIQLTSAALTEGSYTFYANAANASGPSPCSSASAAYLLDLTPPVLSVVTLASDNVNSSTLAKAGDNVILYITASEAITAPSVIIAGKAAAVSGSGSLYVATILTAAGDPQGPVSVNIGNYSDMASLAGNTVTATTDGSAVAIDTQINPATNFQITVVAAGSALDLSWNNPTDLDFAGALVLRKTASYATDPADAAATLVYNGTASLITDSGLTNGTAYFYSVFSYDNAGNFAAAARLSATPAADTTPPAEVTAISPALGDGAITLSWTDPNDADFDHIEITWAPGGLTPQSVLAGVQNFMATGLTGNTSYTFTVQTVDTGGNASSGTTLASTAITYAGVVADDVALLQILFNGTDTASSVTSNLSLPMTGMSGDTTVSWLSSNPAVISNMGDVTRPAIGSGDAMVTLTATVTYIGSTTSGTTSYTLNVLESVPSGVPDTAFGVSGSLYDPSAGGSYGKSVAIQSDGKLVIAGTYPGVSDIAIWRKLSTGAGDTAFNATGKLTLNNVAGGNGTDSAEAIAIQADGKIVIAGYSTGPAGNNDMILGRYNPDGTADTTFNTTGWVVHHNAAGGNSHDYGKSLVIQPDGKLVVAGYSRNAAANFDMVIWRYNTNGTPDTSFNATGFVVHDSAAGGNGTDYGYSIAIQPDGKLLVTGSSVSSGGNSDMTIWRYNSDGTPDTSFNTSGYAVHNSAAGGTGSDGGYSVAIQADGKVVVGGLSFNAAGNFDMTIWRYNANGTLDTTFNGTGFLFHDSAAGGNANDMAYSIVLQADGKIVATGYSAQTATNYDMALWRYNSDGTLDTGFNGSGFVTHNSAANGNGNDYGNAIAIQPGDGKLVVAGSSADLLGNQDMAVWRYLP